MNKEQIIKIVKIASSRMSTNMTTVDIELVRHDLRLILLNQDKELPLIDKVKITEDKSDKRTKFR
jgi:hypothetical protein